MLFEFFVDFGVIIVTLWGVVSQRDDLGGFYGDRISDQLL
jgi:hypothetical protein